MTRVALVTGANQGLGLALAERLARLLAPGDVVHLTGRDARRVQDAADGIADPVADVRPGVLDVRDGAEVTAFAGRLLAEHGGVDVVISNAAARQYPGVPFAEQVEAFADTNNLGTTRVLRSFAPILRPGGRLLVVASSFGTLRNLPPRLHDRFDTDTMSLDDVDAVVARWTAAVVAGTAAAQGWPDWINTPSKIAQVAAVRVLARQRRDRDLAAGTLIAAVCPGLIDTEASRPWFADMSTAQTPAAAAVAPVELALGPVRPAQYGELVRFGEIVPWR